LLHRLVDQKDSGFFSSQRFARLRVESREIVLQDERGGRQRLKRDDGAFQLSIDIARKGPGHLYQALLDRPLLQGGHVVYCKDSEGDQRTR
jgi:hypothetical protein